MRLPAARHGGRCRSTRSTCPAPTAASRSTCGATSRRARDASVVDDPKQAEAIAAGRQRGAREGDPVALRRRARARVPAALSRAASACTTARAANHAAATSSCSTRDYQLQRRRECWRRKPRSSCSSATCRSTWCSRSCAGSPRRRSRRDSRTVQLRAEQLAAHLAKTLAPLYTVFGDEPLLALEAADRIRAAAREQRLHRARGADRRARLRLERARIRGAQPVALRRAQARRAAHPHRQARHRRRRGDAALLRAACPRHRDARSAAAARLARRRSRPGSRRSTSAGVVVEARPVDAQRAAAVARRAAERSSRQRAPRETLEFIADRVEGNLLAAHQEVQKLALLFPPGELGFEQVREAVLDVARYDVVRPGEAMLAGDALRASRACSTACEAKATRRRSCCGRSPRSSRAIGAIHAGRRRRPAGRRSAAREPRRGVRASGSRCQSYRRAGDRGARHAGAIDRMIKGSQRRRWDELLQLGLRFARSKPAYGARCASRWPMSSSLRSERSDAASHSSEGTKRPSVPAMPVSSPHGRADYMHGVGRAARAARARRARRHRDEEPRARRRWPRRSSARASGCSRRIARDVEAARAGEARRRAHRPPDAHAESIVEQMADGLRAGRGAARPGRRDHRSCAHAPVRHPGRPACACRSAWSASSTSRGPT